MEISRNIGAETKSRLTVAAALSAGLIPLLCANAQIDDGSTGPTVETEQDTGPGMDETVEYIGAKVASCWSRAGVNVSGGRMTAANWSAVRLDLGIAMDDPGRDGGIEWSSHAYPARIEVDLSDLSTTVSEPVAFETDYFRNDIYVVGIKCMAPNCMRTLDYVDEDGEIFQNDWWDGRRDWWSYWVYRDYQLTAAINYNWPNRTTSAHEFVLCDSDSANRVRRALSHLIRLGGGRDELF